MSPSLSEEVLQQSGGTILVDGTTNIRELNKAFDWALPADGSQTVNGMVLEELGDIPSLNVQVQIGKYNFEVLSMNDNVIKQVRVTPD
ncbi:hypothetical protein Ppb6_03161 [Photorhabdus australis subsp. thailandensis]|uniref:Transporter-associated domain-containing protein n=1 Tax=Photorhabdus australis subsp. thailandensis TaxID=2805096 RepID=A0A1C0U0Y9_9GAMM|nr:hypothetical protein Ppb6_03161 [Photorhabdus australis subsp. thailandensis]